MVTESEPRRVVVVGGGVAAQRCAFKLRTLGFDGEVTMVSAELDPPYDRTLLSKTMLTAEKLEPTVALRPADAYAEAGIDLRLGVRATRLDAGARRLEVSDGTALPYDRLVVATGGRPVLPRTLACPGVLLLREVADVGAIREAMDRAGRLVVVGGGFIGGEVASSAAARGVAVTLIEAAPAPLAPVLGARVGARVAGLHRAAGVDLRCGVPVTGIESTPGGFRVALEHGGAVEADTVLVGTGMAPRVEWLDGSGLELDNGVVADSRLRTALSGVLAAGDCARWHNPRYGLAMRVEHWDTAARHGAAAAASALGDDTEFDPLPFFWSDQHGVKLQWVGYAPRFDEVEVEEGEGTAFVARYRVAGRLVGVLAAGLPRAVAAARKELLADPRPPSLVDLTRAAAAGRTS